MCRAQLAAEYKQKSKTEAAGGDHHKPYASRFDRLDDDIEQAA